jgi:phenylalanyl-tRNA synthetase alpha chain
MNDLKRKLHPVTQITNDMVRIFTDMGFSVAMGPEMETEWNNFDALNVPGDHPARDMQDTFWIKTDGKPQADELERSLRPVMRTHTSPVQIRYMQEFIKSGKNLEDKTIAIIAPGKVFRNEATDATHEAQFHQIEGLVVGKNITMGDLKGTLLEFFKRFIGPDVEIRLRPSFFPFVEPGLEVDVKVKGKWIEMLGAGLVHPSVLENAGIDSIQYSGFAFGMGIDRLVILKTGIPDVRYLYQGDLRINQF